MKGEPFNTIWWVDINWLANQLIHHRVQLALVGLILKMLHII